MNLRTINKLTQRQFDETLKREGQTITDFYTGDEYQAFFRTMKHSDSTVSKIRLYYSKDESIDKGTLFNYSGETYCVVNKDAVESQTYNTSVACKCSATFLCGGQNIPFVVSDLKNVFPARGNVFSLISGAITIYTGDNDYVRSVAIDDSYIAFGGTYKVVNSFFNDGIGYLYLSRDLSTSTYSVEYTGSYQFSLDDGTAQLTFVAYQGDAVDSTATFAYTSSDPTVAPVDESGVMTMLQAGSATITATWTEQSVSKSVEIDISESIPVGKSVIVDDTRTAGSPYKGWLTIGAVRTTYQATIRNDDGTDAEFEEGTWDITIDGVSIMNHADVTIDYTRTDRMRVTIESTEETETWASSKTAIVTYVTTSGMIGRMECGIM